MPVVIMDSQVYLQRPLHTGIVLLHYVLIHVSFSIIFVISLSSHQTVRITYLILLTDN